MQNAKALTTERTSNIAADIATKDARITELRREVDALNAIVATRDDTIKQLKADIKAMGVTISELKLAQGTAA